MNKIIISVLCLLKILLIFLSCAIPLFIVMAIITKITKDKCWVTKILKKIVK